MNQGATPVTTTQAELGEGVIWDDRRDELLHVDIPAGLMYRERIADDGSLVRVDTHDVRGSIGAVVPIEGDDGWLVARDRGVAYLSLDGVVRPIAELAPAGVKMNDAACDPQGRFWVGTIADVDGGVARALEQRHVRSLPTAPGPDASWRAAAGKGQGLLLH